MGYKMSIGNLHILDVGYLRIPGARGAPGHKSPVLLWAP